MRYQPSARKRRRTKASRLLIVSEIRAQGGLARRVVFTRTNKTGIPISASFAPPGEDISPSQTDKCVYVCIKDLYVKVGGWVINRLPLTKGCGVFPLGLREAARSLCRFLSHGGAAHSARHIWEQFNVVSHFAFGISRCQLQQSKDRLDFINLSRGGRVARCPSRSTSSLPTSLLFVGRQNSAGVSYSRQTARLHL